MLEKASSEDSKKYINIKAITGTIDSERASERGACTSAAAITYQSRFGVCVRYLSNVILC